MLIFVIALILIDSTIRLAMFSNRFLIRSMQLVGATRWFIIKPFILKGILNGLISGILAALALIGLVFYTEQKFPELIIVKYQLDFIIILASVIILGILISWLSTHRAVLKYLNVKLDNLY
jgi:cell division transport system permease protein